MEANTMRRHFWRRVRENRARQEQRDARLRAMEEEEEMNEVSVIWHQQGEWGGRDFTGRLVWKELEADSVFPNILAEERRPILVVDDNHKNGPWGNLEIWDNEWIGRFASGYDHPLAGKFYRGEISIGDTPSELSGVMCPKEIFAGGLGYLHIAEEDQATPPTTEQRTLLVEAIKQRRDREAYYPAGKSLLEWAKITRQEFEGDRQGEVYYTQRTSSHESDTQY